MLVYFQELSDMLEKHRETTQKWIKYHSTKNEDVSSSLKKQWVSSFIFDK